MVQDDRVLRSGMDIFKVTTGEFVEVFARVDAFVQILQLRKVYRRKPKFVLTKEMSNYSPCSVNV